MNHSYFVTGTDTEIGKTLVTAALVYKLNALEPNSACAYKPVVAGTYRNAVGVVCNEDLETYKLVQDPSIAQTAICPYILDQPAAPHIVAAERHMHLDLNHMINGYRALRDQVRYIIAEGAGGFLTPLDPHRDLSDFAKQIELPVILTVGIRLGCINHSLLTVEAIERRGLRLAGWVANVLVSDMPYQAENIATLRERIRSPLLGTIEHLPPHLQKQTNAPYSIGAIQWAATALQLP